MQEAVEDAGGRCKEYQATENHRNVFFVTVKSTKMARWAFGIALGLVVAASAQNCPADSIFDLVESIPTNLTITTNISTAQGLFACLRDFFFLTKPPTPQRGSS